MSTLKPMVLALEFSTILLLLGFISVIYLRMPFFCRYITLFALLANLFFLLRNVHAAQQMGVFSVKNQVLTTVLASLVGLAPLTISHFFKLQR